MLGKLEATANINTSGVGLGLSTCKKIAEALNGEIFLLDDEVPISKLNKNDI
jgi:signal transduction histidine kinase